MAFFRSALRQALHGFYPVGKNPALDDATPRRASLRERSLGHALFKACHAGDPHAARLLLASGSHPENLGRAWRCLGWAAAQGNMEMLRLLLNPPQGARAARVNARSKDGSTALMLAASGGFLDACQALLNAGADPALRDANGFCAAERAALAGRVDAFELLWSAHPRLGAWGGGKALALALRHASDQVFWSVGRAVARPGVEALVRHGAPVGFWAPKGVAPGSVPRRPWKRLAWALPWRDPSAGWRLAVLGSAPALSAWIQNLPASPHSRQRALSWRRPSGENALWAAARGSDPECLRILLDAGLLPQGAEPEKGALFESQPLFFLESVARRGQLEVARVAIERSRAWKACMAERDRAFASACGRGVAWAELFNQGNPNVVVGPEQRPALLNALEIFGRPEESMGVCSWLLARGANPNLATSHGFTPLMAASAHGNMQALDLLALAGADVFALDDLQRCALAWALFEPSRLKFTSLQETVAARVATLMIQADPVRAVIFMKRVLNTRENRTPTPKLDACLSVARDHVALAQSAGAAPSVARLRL
jgi:ankyrin repeat protein